MTTATGAPYLHFEATYCPEDEGGCGQLLDEQDWEGERDDFPPSSGTPCPNCGHAPLAHVNVTSADSIPT